MSRCGDKRFAAPDRWRGSGKSLNDESVALVNRQSAARVSGPQSVVLGAFVRRLFARLTH